jgi:uncharacterized membrane protein
MTLLACGLIIFFATHLLPTRPAWRLLLQAKLGPNRYRGLFSLGSMLGFILIVIGMGRAPHVSLWEPPAWGRLATVVIMFPTLYSITASFLSSRLTKLTAHPMLWGMTLWAAGHLLSNGDLASVLLFASFACYSLFDMASANRRGARPKSRQIPFKDEAKVLLVTALVFIGLLLVHPYIAGVPVGSF